MRMAGRVQSYGGGLPYRSFAIHRLDNPASPGKTRGYLPGGKYQAYHQHKSKSSHPLLLSFYYFYRTAWFETLFTLQAYLYEDSLAAFTVMVDLL
jgi:hypothetical protein